TGRPAFGERVRAAFAHGTSRRLGAVPTILVVAVVLVVAATGLSKARLALTPVRGLSGDAPALQANRDAQRGFVAGVVAPTELVLLALFLRSLVAPVLLVGASLLGIAATLGLTALFMRAVTGSPDVTYYVPLAVGVLLLPLGTDYNLFIVGRIWQEAGERDTR